MTRARTGLSDTSPEAERVLTELLRRATAQEHFAASRALSETAMWHAWRAIAENNPGADEDELRVRFVATYYGPELSRRFAGALQKRRQHAAA